MEDIESLFNELYDLFRAGGLSLSGLSEMKGRELDLEKMFKAGVLRKSQLEDGKYYLGKCRNAIVAKWSAEKQKFTYMRTKFNQTFPETINHPEDDNGYDLFVPIRKIIPMPKEVITNGK